MKNIIIKALQNVILLEDMYPGQIVPNSGTTSKMQMSILQVM